MWDYQARVERDKDGDTLLVVLDQGFTNTVGPSLRLLDVYAPESSDPGGPETAAFVEQWIADRNIGSWPFVVTTERIKSDAHEVMSFDRYVGTLTTRAGESLNDAVEAFVTANGYGPGITTPKAHPARSGRKPT